jgi:hypothetical protein
MSHMAEAQAQPESPDPLGRLHRMSTTAGAASTEYVAIHPFAIAAAVAAFASGLVFIFDSPVFFAVPLAAMGLAIVSLRQIGRSNATQTGRMAALAAIIVALAFSGARLYRDWSAAAATAPDEKVIADTIHDLGQRLKDGQYSRAYGLFGPIFRAQFGPQEFEEQWASIMGATQRSALGRLTGMRGTGRVQFFAEGNQRLAGTAIIMQFERGEAEKRLTVILQQTGEGSIPEWRIASLADIFQRPPAGPPPGGKR